MALQDTDQLLVNRSGASYKETALNVKNYIGVPTQATETALGIAELATQAETNTGTDDLRIVTPLKLAGRISSLFTNPVITGTINEDVYIITGSAAFAVDPANGSVQLVTLTVNSTPVATNFKAGDSVTMMIDDGNAFTVSWTDTSWGTGGIKWTGGTAPTLATTGYTVVQLWKVGTQVYGVNVGDVA